MIDSKYFLKGFASIRGVRSPAIALGASFIAIGALLKNIGFTIQESIFSTFLTYALPGSLVMAESMIIGASLINIFIAVSSWLIMKDNYEQINKESRIDFWIGIGVATWSVAIFSTFIGYIASDFLNRDMLIGLAIINPIYFTCMMVGAMKTIKISLSIILGTILGPAFYFISPEWCILFGGFVAGTIAFFIGEINDR